MDVNFELCDKTFCDIADVSGDRLDINSEPHECQVVTLVWHTAGLVMNGGFGYLLEATIVGDPHLLMTERAFSAIGATRAFDAFHEMMTLFPGCTPPQDVKERARIYELHPKSVKDAIGRRFYAAEGEVERCLALYIHQHQEAIDVFVRRGRADS